MKDLLALGVVRLRKVRAECMRCRTRERSGSSRLAAMRRKAYIFRSLYLPLRMAVDVPKEERVCLLS